MIIQTGCRPSEALYAANFKRLWTKDGKDMILKVPPNLSKNGFEQWWTFDKGYGAGLANRLYQAASDRIPGNRTKDEEENDFKYHGLYDYFTRINQTLNLSGYQDRFGAQRQYSLKFLRRKKAE